MKLDTTAVCEVCREARPLYLFRLRSLATCDGRGGVHVSPSSALCADCGRASGAVRWFATRKAVAA